MISAGEWLLFSGLTIVGCGIIYTLEKIIKLLEKYLKEKEK